MKRFLLRIYLLKFSALSLILLFCSKVGAQDLAPWEWQNPEPQGLDILDNYTVDGDRALAVGSDGTVLRTEDGGHSWDVEHWVKGYDVTLCAVDFVGKEHCWVAGYEGVILHSADGGKTWTDLTNDSLPGIENIRFLDKTTGWAVGSHDADMGIVMHTKDGGNTWELDTLSDDGYFVGMSFIDDSTGWIGGSGVNYGDNPGIYRTTDGGATWDSISPHRAYRIQFANDSLGWAIDNQSDVLARTVDGGVSWDFQLSFLGTGYFADLHFLDDSIGVVVRGEKFYRSEDGGLNWKLVQKGGVDHSGMELSSVHFRDGAGWAMGALGGSFKSTDKGQHWNERSEDVHSEDLSAVHFPSSSTGFVSSESGVLKTEQGGEDWSFQAIDPYLSATDVFFHDEEKGWILAGSDVLRTSNGGADWKKVEDSLVGNFRALHFTNASLGIAVGGYPAPSRMARTQDGGENWNMMSQNSGGGLYDLHFPDPAHGWAVGRVGTIYRTSDGGKSWTDVSLDTTTPELRGVHFVDDQEGWVAGWDGNGGVIFHTSDGGDTWALQDTSFPRLRDVHFVNADEGWVVGDSGVIAHTDNGGADWHREKEVFKGYVSWLNSALYEVYFTDPKRGWAVGNRGMILHYNEAWSSTPSKEPLGSNGLRVFPNPVSERLRVAWSGKKRGDVELTLYDPYGKLLRQKRVEMSSASSEWRLDVSGLARGLYILRASFDADDREKTVTRKVVVR